MINKLMDIVKDNIYSLMARTGFLSGEQAWNLAKEAVSKKTTISPTVLKLAIEYAETKLVKTDE